MLLFKKRKENMLILISICILMSRYICILRSKNVFDDIFWNLHKKQYYFYNFHSQTKGNIY